MKQLILLALVVFSLAACKKSSTAETTTTTTETTTEPAATTTTTTTTETTVVVPTFTDKATQDYVDAYEAYFNDYRAAVNSKDLNKLNDLGKKGAELNKQGAAAIGKLTTEEAQKLTNYLNAKAEQFKVLSQEIMSNK